jgi:hypothetical protein
VDNDTGGDRTKFTQAFEITQWDPAAYDEGDLAGLAGSVTYEPDEAGARITVAYELPW